MSRSPMWWVLLLLPLTILRPAAASDLFENVLVNPGFEDGVDDTNFAGWTVFNTGHRYSGTSHSGSYAVVAWTVGWPPGGWNASGAAQDYPAQPGQIWEASVWAMAPSNLQGRAFGGLKMEFYTASTGLIFEGMSPRRITSQSATQQWFRLAAKARCTPGTAFIRIAPLYVESPDHEPGAVWFDDASLCLVPTSRIVFAGREWIVVDGISSPPDAVHPNYYSTNCVSVDSNGWLHMELKQVDGAWHCPFLEGTNSLGFGEYRWQTASHVDRIDTNLVAGLFFYALEPVFGTNQIEVDIEFSRGLEGTQTNCLLYTVQPYWIPGNGYQHPMDLTNDLTTHRFVWRPDRIDWQSYYGHTPEPLDIGHFIAGWRFAGRGIPIETNEVPYMNLWLVYTNAPRDTQGLEMIVSDFTFVPFDGFLEADEFDDGEVSNLWDVVGAAVAETGGGLVVEPAGTAAAGYATCELVHRNERGTRYVFSALLSTVTVAAAQADEDVRALMWLSSGTNDAFAASNAAVLRAGYDSAGDTLTFAFRTKTNAPAAEGDLRFEGVLSNAAPRLGAGGLEVRMEMSDVEYAVAVRGAAGAEIALATNAGSSRGAHGQAEALCFAYWFVGAQNGGAASQGSVSWGRAAVGVADQAEPRPVPAPRTKDGAMEVVAPGFFDTRCTVERSTNLQDGFVPLFTNLPVRAPLVTVTDAAAGARAFYRTRLE